MADTGYSYRIEQIRKAVGYLPAWKCETVSPLGNQFTFYVCGKCFASKGDGPYTSTAEMWTAGAVGGNVVPDSARCYQCGGRCWPKD